MAVSYGSAIVVSVINAVIIFLFKFFGPLEKHYTTNKETKSTFIKLCAV